MSEFHSGSLSPPRSEGHRGNFPPSDWRLEVVATGTHPSVHDPKRVGEDRQYRFHPTAGYVQRADDHSQAGTVRDAAVGSVTEVAGSVPIRQVPAWCWPLLGTSFSGFVAVGGGGGGMNSFAIMPPPTRPSLPRRKSWVEIDRPGPLDR
jgi:hypothetical protein